MPGRDSSLFTLNYVLSNASNRYVATGVADAATGGWTVTIDSTTTATFEAGAYVWRSYVEEIATPANRFLVDEGELEVLASIFDATPRDQRSQARRALDAIEAVLERRASLDQMKTEIAGINGSRRALERFSLDELLKLRSHYLYRVRKEEGKSALLRVRFG